MKSKNKYILELTGIIILFFAVSYLVQSNISFFENLIKNKYGVLFYFLFVQLGLVFAPLSSMPLVPIMSNIFGPFFTGIITWFSWVVGSVIVFMISRKFGAKIISKLVNLKNFSEFEKKIPQTEKFYGLILLRMITPVDLLSYFMGLFTKIRFRIYLPATVLGLIPLAFATSYFGALEFNYQVVLFAIVLVLFLILIIINKILNKKSK